MQRKGTRMVNDGEDSHLFSASRTKSDFATSKLASMSRSDSHLGVLQRTAN